MTTLALYAVSAALFAASPPPASTTPEPGQGPDPAALAPRDETATAPAPPRAERPAPALHARRAPLRDDSAVTRQRVASTSNPNAPFNDWTDAYLFQQDIWTAP